MSSAKCNDGDVKIYSLDVDRKTLRHEDSPINFNDPRMRCIDYEGERECRFLCVEADDLDSILGPQ